MASVLVVDDEADIRSLVRELLERAGHDGVEAGGGNEGLRAFFSARPDLVVLDVSMPGLDGWGTLERIRELSDVPVVMLTAQAQELAKVRGLRGGADDYIKKALGGRELLARVDANLRRPRSDTASPATDNDGFVTVDFAQRTVEVEGTPLSLTPLEFRMLAAFVRNSNQVLSHEQLLELAWGDARNVERDQVKLYVGYLRRKLGVPSGEES